MTWREQLEAHFKGWPELDQQSQDDIPSIGSVVTGVVVARAHFGVWLDVNCQIPALLLVVEFKDAGGRRHEFDDYPAIGDIETATVVARKLSGPMPQLGLSQIRIEDRFESSGEPSQ